MTTKLTPDQLHRLIDEVAELAYRRSVKGCDLAHACRVAACEDWWFERAWPSYVQSGRGHAGLSAVLILLSEGG